MEKAEKVAKVEEFRSNVESAQSVILAEFRGLNVNDVTELRKQFRAKNVIFRVIKNTLAKLAIADTEMAIIGDQLVGPTAWAWSDEDPVVPAKVLMDFLKDRKDEAIIVKGGYLAGKLLDAADVLQLSKLPGKDELRSKLLSLFQAPATQLVRVLAARPVELLNVFKARADKLGE